MHHEGHRTPVPRIHRMSGGRLRTERRNHHVVAEVIAARARAEADRLTEIDRQTVMEEMR